MTARELAALLPVLTPAAAAVVLMLVIAVRRCHGAAVALTLLGLGGAGATLWVAGGGAPQRVTALFLVDGYALCYQGLILSASLVVALFLPSYLRPRGPWREEAYLLLLLATSGAAALVAAVHFASLFLALEVLSVSLYGLIAYERGSDFGAEAGLKYLVLASVSSAFLLFGMALIYAETGTMEFAALGSWSGSAGGLVAAGSALILVGVGFKLALVPFHLWTPDVYQGAPPPIAGFVATVSKGAVFALLLRYFAAIHATNERLWPLALSALAVASMLVGNLLALRQENVKRLLAYSSIAHLGYVVVALLVSGAEGAAAAAFYLVTYFVTSLGAWGTVTALSAVGERAETLDHYRGLAWRRPWLAATFTAVLLSLAGLPLTAGFMGKLYLVSAGVASGLWLLLITLVIGTAIGLVYYLRVLLAVFERPEEAPPTDRRPFPLAPGLALGGLLLLLLAIGVYPAPLLDLIRTMASSLYP